MAEEFDIMYAQLADAVDYWLFDPKPMQPAVNWTNRDASSGWFDSLSLVVECR